MKKRVNNPDRYRSGAWWAYGPPKRHSVRCRYVVVLLGLLAGWPLRSGAQTPADAPAPERCAVVGFERALQQRFPQRRAQIDALNEQLRDPGGMRQRLAANETVFRIPVVVHVIHSTADGTVGGPGNANISAEQIASQIRVLNEDYRRQTGTPGFNTNPIGADTGIEFFLATTDPQGRPTTGITRHYYDQKSEFDADSAEDALLLSSLAYWPSDRYLNIWLAPLTRNFLGFAQFPTAADTLQGLERETDERTDGVIIDYRYFGRRTGTVTSPTYCCGRTTTHEVGHWLGLIHTWGDGGGCNEDYVYDTPPTQAANQTFSCPERFSNCLGVRTRNQIENYMDYSPDACMNLFTRGQRERMRAVLQLSPRRARLIRSVEPLPQTDVLTLAVYPNPTRTEATVEITFRDFAPLTLMLFDLQGRLLQTYRFVDVPSTRLTLPVADLPAGLYILRASTGRETTSRRVLVQ